MDFSFCSFSKICSDFSSEFFLTCNARIASALQGAETFLLDLQRQVDDMMIAEGHCPKSSLSGGFQQMSWLTLKDALPITGHHKTDSLANWLWRWNQAHPNQPIRRRFGMVHKSDLEKAVNRQAKEFVRSSHTRMVPRRAELVEPRR